MNYTVAPPPLGVYRGISDEEYHSWNALNASVFKAGDTEREWRHEMLNPSPSTGAQRLGTLLHLRLLQPKVYAKLITVPVESVKMPSTGRSRKLHEGAEIETFQAADAECGGIAVCEDWLDLIEQMGAVAYSNPAFAELMGHVADDERELSIVWEDRSGVICKCRIDALARMDDPDDGEPTYYLCDVKSSRSIKGFASDIYKLKYHVAAAHYIDGVKHGMGLDPSRVRMVFFVIQKPPVLDCLVMDLDPAYLDVGRTELIPLKQRFVNALVSGKWPGYADSIEPRTMATPPYWVMGRFHGGE